jgi:hypothetical protein
MAVGFFVCSQLAGGNSALQAVESQGLLSLLSALSRLASGTGCAPLRARPFRPPINQGFNRASGKPL